ncbi:MAG: diaminopimelate epimerase [Oscillospiraceae bacterium]|nr:diaminopimelate epimerase [Oscillospiraceae bacterium]
MKFSKMHGISNDYVYVNGFTETVGDPNSVSKFVSDRRCGIGSDGLIMILPSEVADCRMRMFNADGSEGMMCGNGIRCVGKFAYDNGIVTKPELSVETKSGIKYITLEINDGVAVAATVDMGRAILRPAEIPVKMDGEDCVAKPIMVNGQEYTVTCVSMGNPHCIVFCDDPADIELEKIGPHFEHHELFPERINTEFLQVIDETTLNMRVWERGSGETFACGTGACACVVAAVLNGYCKHDTEVTVHLLGGDLKITYQSDGTVMMTGPATHVYDGEIDIAGIPSPLGL